jgi:exonuclease VII small subunit
MSEKNQSIKYEDNYIVLERITESLNKDEIGIDDLIEKTREALDAARNCMDILNRQKGEFKKLETEFSQLLKGSAEEVPANDTNIPPQNIPPSVPIEQVGQDDPF